LRACASSQFPSAREEVSVNVRFRDVRDPQSFGASGERVLSDVSIRIDDAGRSGGLAAHQVARLREAIVIEALEEHRR